MDPNLRGPKVGVHFSQTDVFLRLLDALKQTERKLVVVMEPTGTYGDAIRYQCHALGLSVHMMPPKYSHDFAEVLDGVPSMHDPKAATVLARLQAIKPGRAWEPESVARRDLRAWVDQRSPIARTLALHHGHLEAMLARHWPDSGRWAIPFRSTHRGTPRRHPDTRRCTG